MRVEAEARSAVEAEAYPSDRDASGPSQQGVGGQGQMALLGSGDDLINESMSPLTGVCLHRQGRRGTSSTQTALEPACSKITDSILPQLSLSLGP